MPLSARPNPRARVRVCVRQWGRSSPARQPYTWDDFESVATRAAVGNAVPRPGFKQWVVDQKGAYDGRATTGSSFSMSSFPGASPSSYGRQIVIFKGAGTIVIERSFGPTILAPFAHVVIDGSVT
jgi:hypothetical protein